MGSLLTRKLTVSLTILCTLPPWTFPSARSQAQRSYCLLSFLKTRISSCLFHESCLDNLFPPGNPTALNLYCSVTPHSRLPCLGAYVSRVSVLDCHKGTAGPLRTGGLSLHPHWVAHSIIRPGVIDTCVLQ